jgi:hypothetical protein
MRGLLRPVRRPAMLALVAAMVAATGTACGIASRHSSAPTNVRFPNTAAGRQPRWLFAAVRHLPIPDAAITAWGA